jgi:hypothetical protein
MKKLTFTILALFSLLSVLPGFSQNTFDKTYEFWENIKLTDVIPVEDGYYLCGYVEKNDGFIFLIKSDSNGDTIYTKKYQPGKYYNNRNPFLLHWNRQEIYLAYGHEGATYLQKINHEGDSLWNKKITDGYSFRKVMLSADGNFLFLVYENAHMTLNIIKCDTLGNIMWERDCAMLDSNIAAVAVPSSIVEMPDGKIKVSVNYSQLEFYGDQTIFTFSDSGTFIKKNEVASPFYMARLTEMQIYENDNIAIGSSMGAWFYASKLNADDDTLWTRHYLYNTHWGYFADMVMDEYYNFIMAGVINQINSSNKELALMCFNALGDSLWWSSYNYGNYEPGVHKIALCPDGGFAVVGYIEDFPDAKGKFLKTNKNGLLSGPGISEITGGIEIKLYPNPASDLVFIESSEKVKSVRIFDGRGEEVTRRQGDREKAVIRVSGLAPGLYLVRVNAGEENVSKKIIIMR